MRKIFLETLAININTITAFGKNPNIVLFNRDKFTMHQPDFKIN